MESIAQRIRPGLMSALLFVAFCADSAVVAPAFSMKNLTFQASVSGQSDQVSKSKPSKRQKNVKGKKGATATFYQGSAESRSERERRLLRECRGRPNSGACEGYARP
jgi:hypothetical protein